MDYVKIIEILSTMFILIGVWLVSIPKISGFYIMNIGQIGLILYGILRGNMLFLILQSIILFIINSNGIYNWSKKKVGVTKK